MSYIERRDASVYYDLLVPEQGSKSYVTLVNGHTRSSADFKLLSRQLVDSGHNVLLIDNRASGKSVAKSPFSLTDMYEDVVAVWDELKIPRSAILGISMGGFICQLLASLMPKRVSKLVLVSTASSDEWINRSEGSWTLDEGEIEKKLGAHFAPSFLERNQLLFSSMVKQTKLSIVQNDFQARAEMQRAALKAHVSRPNLEDIVCPTLIIHGDEDRIIDVKAAYEFKERIRQSEIRIFPGVGHLILAENPKGLYAACREFLGQ